MPKGLKKLEKQAKAAGKKVEKEVSKGRDKFSESETAQRLEQEAKRVAEQVEKEARRARDKVSESATSEHIERETKRIAEQVSTAAEMIGTVAKSTFNSAKINATLHSDRHQSDNFLSEIAKLVEQVDARYQEAKTILARIEKTLREATEATEKDSKQAYEMQQLSETAELTEARGAVKAAELVQGKCHTLQEEASEKRGEISNIPKETGYDYSTSIEVGRDASSGISEVCKKIETQLEEMNTIIQRLQAYESTINEEIEKIKKKPATTSSLTERLAATQAALSSDSASSLSSSSFSSSGSSTSETSGFTPQATNQAQSPSIKLLEKESGDAAPEAEALDKEKDRITVS